MPANVRIVMRGREVFAGAALLVFACAEQKPARTPLATEPLDHVPEPGGEQHGAPGSSGMSNDLRTVDRSSPDCRYLVGEACYATFENACDAAHCESGHCQAEDEVQPPQQMLCVRQ
jgi:hypothetical protein